MIATQQPQLGPGRRSRLTHGVRRLHRVGRIAATGVLAAIGAGLLTGLPARVMMRLVALSAGLTPQFSWVGTLGVAIIFSGAALPGAVVAAAWTGRGRWLVSAAGAAFLCIPATGIAAGELGSTDGYSAVRWMEVGAAVLGVYACIAALPLVTARLVTTLPVHRAVVSV